MKVFDFAGHINGVILSAKENAKNKIINGIYVCDLISWAMAKVKDCNAWITVHTNLNVVAVAQLTHASCVIIPENIDIPEIVIKRADDEGISFIKTSMSAYDICVMYSNVTKE